MAGYRIPGGGPHLDLSGSDINVLVGDPVVPRSWETSSYPDGEAMSGDEFSTYAKLTLDRVRDIVAKKNHDYTSGGGPFDNFKKSAEFTEIDPVIGCMNRLFDKLQRIKTWRYSDDLKVKGETVQDAVDDIIGYALLMGGMMLEENGAFEHLKRPVFPEQTVHATRSTGIR